VDGVMLIATVAASFENGTVVVFSPQPPVLSSLADQSAR
jgi:hypothetical protein